MVDLGRSWHTLDLMYLAGALIWHLRLTAAASWYIMVHMLHYVMFTYVML